MPKKLTPLTIKEHVELGNRLKAIEKEYLEIYNKVAHAYGKSSRAGKLLWTQAQSFAPSVKIRCEMDNIVANETTLEEWNKNRYGNIYMGGDYYDTHR